MKKTLALFLTILMMLFLVHGAVAETATDVLEVAAVENGTVVPFTDYNFQITLPSDWLNLEVSDEQAATGILFSCANPDGTRSFTVAYTELEQATDMDAVATELAAAYQNVRALTINDVPYVSYEIAENDVIGLVTLGASGVGLYQFVFYPASDADYGDLALQIAASIATIE